MTGQAVGIDLGTARTKIATAGSVHECASPPLSAGSATGIAEHGSTRTAARRLAVFLGDLFTDLVPVVPAKASVVLAVPDRWAVFGTDSVISPESGRTGQVLLRVLTDAVGFADARLIPGLQCVAAAQARPGRAAGALLVLDVGAATVDAAVYILDGPTTRLVDAAHGDLTSAGWRESPSEAAAAAVKRLLGRFDGPLAPHAVVTGGNATTATLEAIRAAAGGRISSARWADATETARGALLIAQGESTALLAYPHEVAVVAHLIKNGVLETTTLPLSATPTRLTVTEDHSAPLPVVIQLHRTGPWLAAGLPTATAPGSHDLTLHPRHGTYGALQIGTRLHHLTPVEEAG
ncbi:hypothetical protein [Actinokineospora terrae]|uniref:Uncharacterized protein n=1 Tax=Actinokineospora terrae TaxID=155974 RepID=A0A1H9XEJ4_9PSEU|nr:hypothetical protein [Actinokineospora terrae]SES44552.1 hypothetical protein SAMN04487818_114183 [Actinokineospora terrae]